MAGPTTSWNPMKTHFVTYRPKVGRTDQWRKFKREAANKGVAKRWTISSKARPGDCVLIYFAKPVAQIIAVAEVLSKATERNKAEYRMIRRYRPKGRREFCADFHNIQILNEPVTLPEKLTKLCLRNWWAGKPWNSPRRILEPTVRRALLRLVTPSPLNPTSIPITDVTNPPAKAA